MENTCEIPVLYIGKELLFPAEVVRYGYVHRIKISVDGQVVYLEKDEENNYRAIAGCCKYKRTGKRANTGYSFVLRRNT